MNNFPLSFLFTIMALALVLVMAWIILRSLSKLNISKSRNGRLEVLDSVALGSRERVVLIKCDQDEYLLGVTADSVNRIK